MTSRSLIIATLVALVLLVWAAAVQGADMKSATSSAPLASQPLLPVASILASPAITFTPVATTFLPVVFRDYAPCTAAPQFLSPPNGSNLSTRLPLFRWDSGNDPRATDFYLEVSQYSGFTNTYGFSGSSYAQGVQERRLAWNLDEITLYYWRAHLYCGSTEGPDSEVWTFTTGSGGTVLPGASLISPDNGATLPSRTVTFSWSSVSGAAEYKVNYKAGTHYSSYTTGTQLTRSLLPNTTYEWWVEARNDYAWGAESVHWTLTTGATGAVVSIEPPSPAEQQLQDRTVIESGDSTHHRVEQGAR